MTSSLAIVGYGVVGKAMHALMPEAAIYDNAPGMPADKDGINKADIAFVCVPTPAGPDGVCDISAVEEVVAWLTTPLIVLRSTVPPGTTDRLREKHGKRIVFQPEYLGETASHPYADVTKRDFAILGGPEEIPRESPRPTHGCTIRTSDSCSWMPSQPKSPSTWRTASLRRRCFSAASFIG